MKRERAGGGSPEMERLKKDERKPEEGHRGVKTLEGRGREPEEGHPRWKDSRRMRERRRRGIEV